MLRRFTEGEEGRRRLLDALGEQSVVAHNAEVANDVANTARLTQHERGDAVITQDNTDTDICLILAGHVAVEINGRVCLLLSLACVIRKNGPTMPTA